MTTGTDDVLPRLLLLTDRTQLPSGRTLLQTLDACIDAGASTIVLRELDLPSPARAILAELITDRGARVIAAHGAVRSCHAALLPLSALPALHSVTKTPRYKLLGASCHSAADVRRAAGQGADFATLSPFAATPSKPGYGPPLPPAEYAGLPIPVHALGGITPANAAEAIATGASGIAVMGEVMRADDPGEVVRELLEAIR